MFFDNQWILFHCIRTRRIDPYQCRPVQKISDIKFPEPVSDEYLIPISLYIPMVWREYFLKKNIANGIRIQILS